VPSSGALRGDIAIGEAGGGPLSDGLLVDVVELLAVGVVLPLRPRFGAVIEFIVSGQQVAVARNTCQ
jgi:hypothetical protein